MQYTLLHRGLPIATLDVDFASKKSSGGPLSLLPGSGAFEETVRDAWRAIANHGFMPPPGKFVGGVNDEGDRQGRRAIARFGTLEQELEWRDEDGQPVVFEMASLFGSGDTSEPLHALLVLPGGFDEGADDERT